jgi:hypothetical protein
MTQRIVVVPRSGKRKGTTVQTVKDHNDVMSRRLKAGERYHQMTKLLAILFGPKVTRAKMFTVANSWCETFGFEKPDRVCQREKEALICWFCDHLDIVLGSLNGASLEPEISAQQLSHLDDSMPPTGDDTPAASMQDFLDQEDEWPDDLWNPDL